jgi:hypothetical protein
MATDPWTLPEDLRQERRDLGTEAADGIVRQHDPREADAVLPFPDRLGHSLRLADIRAVGERRRARSSLWQIASSFGATSDSPQKTTSVIRVENVTSAGE